MLIPLHRIENLTIFNQGEWPAFVLSERAARGRSPTSWKPDSGSRPQGTGPSEFIFTGRMRSEWASAETSSPLLQGFLCFRQLIMRIRNFCVLKIGEEEEGGSQGVREAGGRQAGRWGAFIRGHREEGTCFVSDPGPAAFYLFPFWHMSTQELA